MTRYVSCTVLTAAVLGKTKAVTGIAATPWGLGSGLFVTLQTGTDSDTAAAKQEKSGKQMIFSNHNGSLLRLLLLASIKHGRRR